MTDKYAPSNPPQKPTVDPARVVSRFPTLEDEYVKTELHNGIVLFADIRDFSSYMDANSDYAISLLACFRRVLSRHLSAGTLKANEGDRYTTFAKELGDGVMMMWIAEEGSITDISVDDITGLLLVSQEAVKSFFELSADFAPEKYHVGIGIAIGSFQRLLYPDKGSSDRFLYRDYCGGTINMAARVESLSRPNGVSVFFHALPLNKKKEIHACITAHGFKESTQEIRGIGKTQVYQWKFSADEPSAGDEAVKAQGNSNGASVIENPRGQPDAKAEKLSN